MSEFFKFIVLPSNLIIVLSVPGILLSLKSKFRRPGKYLLLTAIFIYVIFATGPVSFWLLGNLEYQYPYLNDFDSINEIEYIVVLSGYAERDFLLPLSSRVNESSAFRLLEALKISNEVPESRIIISGKKDVSEIMKELIISIGVSKDKIIVENQSGSTYESAHNIFKLLGNEPFVLVTSAGHMPRSMHVFRKTGMNPIPAPTQYLTKKNNLAISYLPSPLHLRYSDLAIHEYIGIFWYRLMGKI